MDELFDFQPEASVEFTPHEDTRVFVCDGNSAYFLGLIEAGDTVAVVGVLEYVNLLYDHKHESFARILNELNGVVGDAYLRLSELPFDF